MKRFVLLLLIFVFVLVVSLLTAPAGVSSQDLERDALVAFYNSTNGANWYDDTGWLDDTVPHCNWYGVECDSNGNVITLWLEDNRLDGTIPPELGNLSSLRTLDLHDNSLKGPIPPELGNLSNLRNLILDWNQLSDLPPELGKLSNLEELDLYANKLIGPIPPELGNLSSLGSLNLGANQLSGSIPPELGNLSSLGFVNLGQNELSGPIPPELGNLSNLEGLNLRWNQLSGPIPAELGNLSNLGMLILADNQLICWETQELLDWAHNVSKGSWDYPYPGEGICLERDALVAFCNSTNGPWGPSYYGEEFDMWLSDTIPHCEWTGVKCDSDGNVIELSFYKTGLNGPLPPELGNLSNLESLDIGKTELSGPIPPELGNLNNLVNLTLFDNRNSGPIPPELGNLSNLRTLNLSDNSLSGPIPPEFGNLSNLEVLELDDNDELSGPIPAELGNLGNLERLELQWNQLSCWGTQGVLDWAKAIQGSWDYPYPGESICSCPDVPGNLVANYCFEDGPSPWLFYTNGRASYETTDSDPYQGQFAAEIDIVRAGGNVQLYQKKIALKPNTPYELLFAAYSSNGNDLSVYVHKHKSPYTNYGLKDFKVNLLQGWQVYQTTFTTRGFSRPVNDGRLRFWMAPYDANDMSYHIDWVVLREVDAANPPIPEDPPVYVPPPGYCANNPGNLVQNPGFEAATNNWNFYTNGAGSFETVNVDPYECENNVLVSISKPGSNVQLYQTNISLQPGTPYYLRLAARSSGGEDVKLYLHKHSSPYTNYGLNGVQLDLTDEWQVFMVGFNAKVSRPVNNGRLRIWMAPFDQTGTKYEFDDVVLLSSSQASQAATRASAGDSGELLRNGEVVMADTAAVKTADSVLEQGYFLDGDEAGRLAGGYVGEQEEGLCYNAQPSQETLVGPNGTFANIRILGLGRPKNVTITSITQDEPVGEKPDAYGIGKARARIRRERDDDGEGRVYHIGFTAKYRMGKQCSHEVVVTVPVDRETPAIDSGQRYDATLATP